jgi:hypothetical protein
MKLIEKEKSAVLFDLWFTAAIIFLSLCVLSFDFLYYLFFWVLYVNHFVLLSAGIGAKRLSRETNVAVEIREIPRMIFIILALHIVAVFLGRLISVAVCILALLYLIVLILFVKKEA